jgi:methylenetetrahydrofolate reductase (NADPH)
MSFAGMLRAGRFPVALEVTPPRTADTAILLRRARMLGDAVDAVDVIQRQGRMPSLDAALELAHAGIGAVWNLTSRGRTRGEIGDDLERAAAAGLDAVLCLRGDYRAPDLPETPRLFEVVARAREACPGGLVGATFDPDAPRERALRNLFGKIASGAGFVQTQPVFDVDRFLEAARAIRRRWPAVKVVAMAMPLLSLEEARRFQGRLRVRLPDALLRRLSNEADAEEAGFASFGEVLRCLRESSLVDGLAVMTPKLDPPKQYCDRIASYVERARSR